MIATDFNDPDGDGGRAFDRVLYRDLLVRLAVLVGATEAAGFRIRRSFPAVALDPLMHVRPDDSSPEARVAAIKAFREIVAPCVEKMKDGAIEVVEGRVPAGGVQFCLVTLTRDVEMVPRAASAFIVRCADATEARSRLDLLKGVGSPYRKRRD